MTRVKQSHVFDDTTLTLTQKIEENGEITQIILVVPNYHNTINTTLTIYDPDGYVLYTTGVKAQNATYIQATALSGELENIPVVFGCYATVLLAGAAGTDGGTVKAILYIKRNKP